MTSRRVVVTGMGALTPIGNDLDSYWNGLISGTSGCANITYFDTSHFKTKFACELKGFDPADYFEKKEYRRYDRFSQYGIVAANEAISWKCKFSSDWMDCSGNCIYCIGTNIFCI